MLLEIIEGSKLGLLSCECRNSPSCFCEDVDCGCYEAPDGKCWAHDICPIN